MKKLLVVGLDGATWNVVSPLIESGKLPTLKRLAGEGVTSKLIPEIPPVTGPSWLCFASGLNPGKTGVYDFFNRTDFSYRLLPVSSRDYQGRAFWDLLSTKGVGVIVFNFPMLYPPYRVNGVIVSGLGSSPEDEFTFPPELKREIDSLVGGYEIDVPYHREKYEDNELFLRDVRRVLEKRVRALEYILESREWGVAVAIFSETDWIQHLMWRHLDPSHPAYDGRLSPALKEKFDEFWGAIDAALDRILKRAPKDTDLIVVSDHGFGSNDETFNLSAWLVQNGYLRLKRPSTSKPLAIGLARLGNRLGLERMLPTTMREEIGRLVSDYPEDWIDFSRSSAYVLGNTIPFGGMYLNIKGRDPLGFVTNPAGLKGEIVERLERSAADMGFRLTFFEKESIYQGDYVGRAPDIIFCVDDWRGAVTQRSYNGEIFARKPSSSRHTGSHRMEGVFIAHGPSFDKNSQLSQVRMLDLAPTILEYFGLDPPKDLDGKTLPILGRPK